MAGLIGPVPYGVLGSVSALAMGARATAPPIAASANHGARCLIAVFMIFSGLLVGPWFWATPIMSPRKAGVVDADTHLTLALAANLVSLQLLSGTCKMEDFVAERFTQLT